MMEPFRVELTVSLHRKVTNWSKEDQIYFSAFVQSMREMSLEPVLAASNCVIEDATVTTAGTVDELSFWMKLRMDYIRFVVRQPVEGVLILSDR